MNSTNESGGASRAQYTAGITVDTARIRIFLNQIYVLINPAWPEMPQDTRHKTRYTASACLNGIIPIIAKSQYELSISYRTPQLALISLCSCSFVLEGKMRKLMVGRDEVICVQRDTRSVLLTANNPTLSLGFKICIKNAAYRRSKAHY